jgi:hypothetical protein
MKLFKCALLLVVLIGFVSVAEAKDHNHVFSSPLSAGYAITDTVSSNTKYKSDNYMVFTWEYQKTDGSWAVAHTSQNELAVNSGGNSVYTSTLPANLATPAGNWKVTVIEYYTEGGGGTKTKTSTETFTLGAGPEFSFGLFIPLLLAGVMYFVIRRNMVGSCNGKR